MSHVTGDAVTKGPLLWLGVCTVSAGVTGGD